MGGSGSVGVPAGWGSWVEKGEELFWSHFVAAGTIVCSHLHGPASLPLCQAPHLAGSPARRESSKGTPSDGIVVGSQESQASLQGMESVGLQKVCAML